MKIAYLGHPAHAWSKSDEFFRLSLMRDHEVTTFRPSHNDFTEIFPKVLTEKYDLLVFWQLDFLAYPFTALGIPCLVIPMLDGSGAKTFKHWRLLRRCHFLSFSKELTQFLELFRFSTSPISFYPKHNPNAIDYRLKKNQGYAWVRERDQSFSLKELNEIGFFLGLDRILVRNSGTPGQLSGDLKLLEQVEVENLSEHMELVNQSKFFFSPRKVEGIGMSFLEAMALGTLVIARDSPTANNFIRKGVNGFLVGNSGKIRRKDLSPRKSYEECSAESKKVSADKNFHSDLNDSIAAGISAALSLQKAPRSSTKRINWLIGEAVKGFDGLGPGCKKAPRLSWFMKI